MCGTPIAITSSTLKIGFADLLSIFNQYHQKYGQYSGRTPAELTPSN